MTGPAVASAGAGAWDGGGSPGTAWLKENAVLQTLNASAFGGLLAGWLAIGASMAAATGGALALCLAVPVFGWFFGLPLVFMGAMMGASIWVGGQMLLVMGWAAVAGTVALITFGRRLLDSRA